MVVFRTLAGTANITDACTQLAPNGSSCYRVQERNGSSEGRGKTLQHLVDA